jgi:hypothetical protein
MGSEMPERPSEENSPDVEASLHYINEFFVSYRALRTALARATQIQVVLSLVLLALAAGAATTEGALTFSGVGLKVSVAVLLSGGAIVLSMLSSGLFTIVRVIQQTEAEIIRLYESIGFSDHTLYQSFPSPFAHGSAFGMLFGVLARKPDLTGSEIAEDWKPPSVTTHDFLTFDVITRLLIGQSFPVAAVTGTGFKVAELLRPQDLGWIWIVFIVLAVVGSGTYIANVFSFGFGISLERLRTPFWWYIVPRQQRKELFQFVVFLSIFPLIGMIVGFFVVKVLGAA